MTSGKFETCLPTPPKGRTNVLRTGQAAGSMAVAFEKAWDAPCEGIVGTRYGHSVPTRFVEVVEAGHPLPHTNGVETAGCILAFARGAGLDDCIAAFVSGGVSSLLTLPVPDITLELRQMRCQLLASGAPIADINTFRIGLSAIKGGRLAHTAGRAPVETYVMSNVPGEDSALIGSGPTITITRDADAALAAAQRYDLLLHFEVERAIRDNARNEPQIPGPVHVLATLMQALEAAAARAREPGFFFHNFGRFHRGRGTQGGQGPSWNYSYWQLVSKGAVLVTAVGLDKYSSKLGDPAAQKAQAAVMMERHVNASLAVCGS